MQPHSWAGCALQLRLPRPPLCSRGNCTIGATLGSRPKVCRQWARCSVQGGVYQRPGHAFSGGRGPRSRRLPEGRADADANTAASRTRGWSFALRPCFNRRRPLNTATLNHHLVDLSACGEVAEWLKAPHSKCGVRATVSGVRIPPSPPEPLFVVLHSHSPQATKHADTLAISEHHSFALARHPSP